MSQPITPAANPADAPPASPVQAAPATPPVQPTTPPVTDPAADAAPDYKALYEQSQTKLSKAETTAREHRDKAKRLDEIEAAQQTETERANARATAVEQQLATLRRTALDAEIRAAATGWADPSDAPRYLDDRGYLAETARSTRPPSPPTSPRCSPRARTSLALTARANQHPTRRRASATARPARRSRSARPRPEATGQRPSP
ncbi:hypothetical protein BBK82_10720 [Lentzea guizhouensis]|uniref:Uncharacterized protein n=1 Tax=Lentzea guizhouensis TaxID=1586287 RepID=A0A1B2HFC9_9PSEU|nr:hypothetical protein [Lentzea guizhouensis]ANZ36468.1 hypothetical protein BBK82_10720 [Lentzea guizhouensis]